MWDGTATALALLQGRVIPAAHRDAATRLDLPLSSCSCRIPMFCAFVSFGRQQPSSQAGEGAGVK